MVYSRIEMEKTKLNDEIKKLWIDIPNDIKVSKEYILDCIPYPPKCIEYQQLQHFLGIEKNTLTYHLNTLEEKKLIIRLKPKKGRILYITRKSENKNDKKN